MYKLEQGKGGYSYFIPSPHRIQPGRQMWQPQQTQKKQRVDTRTIASTTERILNRTSSKKETFMLTVTLFHLKAPPSSFHFIAASFLSLLTRVHLPFVPIDSPTLSLSLSLCTPMKSSVGLLSEIWSPMETREGECDYYTREGHKYESGKVRSSPASSTFP